MEGACRTHGREKIAYILVENAEGRRPLGRFRRRRQDNIKVDLIGLEAVG
jgi:hypothetical protein